MPKAKHGSRRRVASLERPNGILLTEIEVEQLTGLSRKTLQNWRYGGNSPLPFVRIGTRAIRYRRDDLDKAILAGLTTSTTDRRSVPRRKETVAAQAADARAPAVREFWIALRAGGANPETVRLDRPQDGRASV